MFSSPDGLVGFDTVFPLAHGRTSTNWNSWDGLTSAQIQNDVAVLDWTRQTALARQQNRTLPPAPAAVGIVSSAEQLESSSTGGPVVNLLTPKQSTLWFFKTRDGAMGVLQIVGTSENPAGMRIRYKLLHSSAMASPNPFGYEPAPAVTAPPAYDLEQPLAPPPAYVPPVIPTPPGYVQPVSPSPPTPPTAPERGAVTRSNALRVDNLQSVNIAGASAPLSPSFTVTTSTTAPLSYQWYLTDTNNSSPKQDTARSGTVIERLITSREVGPGGLVFVNLEKGRVAQPPFSVAVDWSNPGVFQRSRQLDNWIAASGMDLALHLGDVNWGFVPLGTQLLTHRDYVQNDVFFNAVPLDQARALLADPSSRNGQYESQGARASAYSVSAGYIYQTRRGTYGLLQISGVTNGFPGVRLRYTLAVPSLAASPPVQFVGDRVALLSSNVEITADSIAFGPGQMVRVSNVDMLYRGDTPIKPVTTDADLKVRLSAAERISSFTERDATLAAIARDAARAANGDRAKQAVSRMTSFTERDQAALVAARELLKSGQRAAAVDLAQTITSFTQRDAALKELAK